MTNVEIDKHDLLQIKNDSILAVAGLDEHKRLDEGANRGGSPTEGIREAVGSDMYCLPVWQLDKLTPKEVSLLTGFHDLNMLLLYVIMICNSNFDNTTQTISSMTWLEEWILSLEFLWGDTARKDLPTMNQYTIVGLRPFRMSFKTSYFRFLP